MRGFRALEAPLSDEPDMMTARITSFVHMIVVGVVFNNLKF